MVTALSASSSPRRACRRISAHSKPRWTECPGTRLSSMLHETPWRERHSASCIISSYGADLIVFFPLLFISVLSKSQNLTFDICGEGNLPRVTIVRPVLRNKHGNPVLLFQRLLIGQSQQLALILKNEGSIAAQVSDCLHTYCTYMHAYCTYSTCAECSQPSRFLHFAHQLRDEIVWRRSSKIGLYGGADLH